MFVNSLFWFDNDFEIESKYHRKIVVLFLKARILSLQDVVFGVCFFLKCFIFLDYHQQCFRDDFHIVLVA